MSTDTELAASWWNVNRHGPEPKGWNEHAFVRGYSDARVTADPAVGWLAWVAARYPAQFAGRALSLCCGFGGMERALVSHGATHVVGVDVAASAIDAARTAAARVGLADRITYEVADVNTCEVVPGEHDLVMAASALHHVFDLEHVLGQIRRGLTPDGILVVADYVGPSRFQVDERTVALVNDVLAALPERLRRSLYDTDRGEVKASWQPPSVDWFLQHDPSEAVRSAEVVAAVRRFFHIEVERSAGGGLLHWLLAGIAGNFDPDDEYDRTVLSLLCILEARLEEVGAVGADHVVLVGRPR